MNGNLLNVVLVIVFAVGYFWYQQHRRKTGSASMPTRSENGTGLTYTVNDIEVVCSHCSGRIFDVRRILMNTSGMTFFNFDWANKEANAMVCWKCGHVEWFTEKPVAKPESTSEKVNEDKSV